MQDVIHFAHVYNSLALQPDVACYTVILVVPWALLLISIAIPLLHQRHLHHQLHHQLDPGDGAAKLIMVSSPKEGWLPSSCVQKPCFHALRGSVPKNCLRGAKKLASLVTEATNDSSEADWRNAFQIWAACIPRADGILRS